MFLVSRPSKRFSTSSLCGGKEGRGENRVWGVSSSLRIQRGVWEAAWHRAAHSFMLRVREMSSSLEKSRIRKW